MNKIYLLTLILSLCVTLNAKNGGVKEREFWVETLVHISAPVLVNLSCNTLRANMPVETLNNPQRESVTHLEAVGRTLCGIAPWLELGIDDTKEGKLRETYINLTIKGLANAVNPESADYLRFVDKSRQPLVDAAFLAQGLLRAPTQLWGRLDTLTKERMIKELKSTRQIVPFESNWLLFASIVEAALMEFTGECDTTKLYYGVDKFKNLWYKGDAWYGDGPHFAMDYYNSFVIHPMLQDILIVMDRHKMRGADFLSVQTQRFTRFAEQQERMISPEGTFPVTGRSIIYRFGAFHQLAHASLLGLLPQSVTPSQVREALTAVVKRQISAPGTFDKKGWLQIGYAGHQLQMCESYISTGSLYLCTAVFLPLGLPADNEFWSGDYAAWTSKKAWSGQMVKADKSIPN